MRPTAALTAGATLTATKPALALTLTRLAVCVTSAMTTATMTLAVIAIGIELPAARSEREVGSLALGNVPFGSRQLRANQRTMDGPFIAFIAFRQSFFDCVRYARSVGGCSSQFGRLIEGRCRRVDFVLVCLSVHGVVQVGLRPDTMRVGLGNLVVRFGGFNGRAATAVNEVRWGNFGLLAPGRRHLRVLVFVLGVTRRAPCLLDVVLDHRDHRMVGDAALARTVVVENVTEPKPALIHVSPLTDSVRQVC